VQSPRFNDAKLSDLEVAIIVYTALHISILAVITSKLNTTQVTAVAAGTTMIGASLIVSLLSWLEHARSLRPSILLNSYLALTLLFDIVQARTLLLESSTATVGKVFTATIIMKVIVLFLEAQPKTRWIQRTHENFSNEETSGPFSLSTFFWLTGLITLGSRKVFGCDDLLSLDESLSAKRQLPPFERAWADSSHRGRMRLIFSLSRAAGRRALYPLLPRMAKISFSFCQPFLIQGLSRYLKQEPGSVSARSGYGWIGATFLIYSGIAITSALYWYLHHRVLTIVRAALVASIFRKMTKLSISHGEMSATLTLMSTDVERIKGGLHSINEIWANAVEVALAAWLLQREIGIAFLIPLAVVVLCVLVTMKLGKFAGKRQGDWIKATQRRVSSISSIIAAMKSVRMLGLTPQLAGTMHDQRMAELNAAKRFRVLGVFATMVGFTPLLIIPVFTFAATSRTLDTERVFTSLAYILLLANPLAQLFQIIPQMVAALACFNRVAEFLLLEIHSDNRTISSQKPESHPSGSEKETVEVVNLKENQSSTKEELSVIAVHWASFGWDPEKPPTLEGISINIPVSKTTVVVGPVSSGKSTLCKALIGELNPLSGVVCVPRALSPIAFCEQTPWLPNETIRDCIIGTLQMDVDWYRTVLECTDLQHDLDQLSEGASTLIGSNGIAISGGQKARLALARALYFRAKFVVLDDVFSGLDKNTESKICERLFGRHGLFRAQGATVILVTHNARHLHFADHIIALSVNGHVVEEGSLSELQDNEKYIASLTLKPEEDIEQSSASISPQRSNVERPTKPPSAPQSQPEDRVRQLGDVAVYRHYFSLFGPLYMVIFLISCSTFGFLYNFSTVWLKFWSDHNMDHPNDASRRDFYLGIYAMIQVLALLVLGVFSRHNSMKMAIKAGTLLHSKALSTLMTAPLGFFSRTDAGTTVNRFSQDMSIIDGELSYGLSNTVLTSAAVLGQAAIIAVASPYVAICYPFLLILLYGIQKLYLRTSRQLRFLDLEAKAPL
jgi:ATP-binding cassette subfamily C (CFTR/MRP) protein 1